MCILYSGKHNNIIPYSKYIIYYISTTMTGRWCYNIVLRLLLLLLFFVFNFFLETCRTYLNIYYRYLRMHISYYNKRFFKRIIIMTSACGDTSVVIAVVFLEEGRLGGREIN